MAGFVSTVSWFDKAGPHLRTYTVNGSHINEQGWDGNGPWYQGAYSAGGTTVGATSWLDGGGQIHIRVYAGMNGQVTEMCWDKDHWYKGAFEAAGIGAGATSWLDGSGQVHIRSYVRQHDNKVIEMCWDKDRWYVGAYHGTAGAGSQAA